ncbi:MAG: hypothetical protein M1831_005806 [Alyxoria varia]|nr:MAG: hypothetical protein M1831_005806 [Alyxoria varia]
MQTRSFSSTSRDYSSANATQDTSHRKQQPRRPNRLGLTIDNHDDNTNTAVPHPGRPQSYRRQLSFDATSPTTPRRPTSSRFAGGHTRAASVESPLRPGFEDSFPLFLDTGAGHNVPFAPRNLDNNPHGDTPHSPKHHHPQSQPQLSSLSYAQDPKYSRRRNASESDSEFSDGDGVRPTTERGGTMPSQKPPDLKVNVSTNNNQSQLSHSKSVKGGKDLKGVASPNKVSNFFGWGSKQNTMESPSTQFSSGTPSSARQQNGASGQPQSPGYLGDDNYFASEDGYSSSRSTSPLTYHAHQGGVPSDELLRELSEVSAELAASIRREMELEDEVDRAKAELPPLAPELNRRTSDYYSDSGGSSARFPVPDADLKMEGLEKMRRKAEQEKAQLRIDMAQKVQEDLNQRRALELHAQSLEEQLQMKPVNSSGDRERELEAALEDTKRRLNEEKEFKQNFEELLAGMREEIEAHRNERDNLRDEVVPQLRAKLEGLESEAGESQNLVYENTRMQQELQNLKNENQTLQNARKLQMGMGGFQSIAEEGDGHSSGVSSPTGLTRSGSLARSKSTRKRSSSIYGNKANDPGSPAELTPDRFKDMEEQRDALRVSLKNLVMRQEQMTRRHHKQVRQLESERDRALRGTPRRTAFHVEVQNLRGQINQLRQRADDALEQKYQCERGLSGLKMDLDRAQQETSSLRDLLHENDISVPAELETTSVTSNSDSLDRAYDELRRAHADSVASRPRDSGRPQSLEAAEARMNQLFQQVQSQQASNRDLRERLAKAVSHGEKAQENSTRRINALQSALRAAEERVMAAQSVSEDAVTKQEEHVRQVKDMMGEQSKRGVMSPNPGTGGSNNNSRSSRSSVFSANNSRTPRLSKTTSGKGVSVHEASRTYALECRVRELEEAAGKADEEMQGVVEKMNEAQIEVAELQFQRDEATQRTRGLQREISEQTEKVRGMGRKK